MLISEEHQDEMQAARQCFVLPNALGIKARLEKIGMLANGLPAEHRAITTAYDATLQRMNSTVLLPYRMAWLGEANVHQQRLTHAAMFKAMDEHDPFESDFDDKVKASKDEIANELYTEFLGSDEGRSALHQGTVRRLAWSTGLDNGRISRAGQDLLLQSVTVTWAAFETFAADTVRTVLNERPTLLRLLIEDDDAKRRISRTRWNLLELLDMGLDLSGRVGDLVLSENDLSDYVSIKSVLLPLFDNP